ncbi:hypothetical protein DL89DRAFT_265667 [Linderina pennispora]|uniref:Uncharacterized protein n=1 Tax=Linderina pennispora TaxID=61395 RepID=A0A1Y1WEL7_9FUNG|nr:uncharacterized protein DL89DRAFT_265667 [Linderina pennispora]ORX71971.1 hypothetical protein DL89DRAFT_265667 [Linderina pennispora]
MRLTHRAPVDTDSNFASRYAQPVNVDTLIDASDSIQDYFLQFPCHKPGDTTIFGPLNTLIISNVDRIKKLLLLSWYPKSSPTWGTIGGIEDAQSACLIPKVLDCGIIVEDLLGYRLEFISFVYSGEDTDPIMKELLRLRDGSVQTMVDQHGKQMLAREKRRLSDRSDVSGSSTEQHVPHHKVPRHR